MFLVNLENNIEELECFISQSNENNFFQSQYFYKLLEKTKNHIPFIYGVKDENSKLLAYVLGYTQSFLFWPATFLTRRAIIIGGPIVKEGFMDALEFLIKELRTALNRKTIYIEIRNQRVLKKEEIKIYEDNKYRYVPHLDIIINLKNGFQQIENNISKNKKRNITKSINKGTKIELIENRDEYLTSIELIEQTYKRINLPLADSSLFINAFDHLHGKGLLKVFAAKFENKIIGVRLELTYNKIIYDWYAGYDPNHKNKYPNDILPYFLLKWASENGFEYFDFGGAGKPDRKYGVRDHKMRFGGELVDYGRFEVINQPFLYNLSTKGLKIYKFINGLRKKNRV